MPVLFIFKITICYSQRIGAAKPSFIKDLIDDYEAMGIEDIEHEEDMIALGGMVFAGQCPIFFFAIFVSNCIHDCYPHP